MKLHFEIQNNVNKTLAVTMCKTKEEAKSKIIDTFGSECTRYTFELRITKRGELMVTYFHYADVNQRKEVSDIAYFEINRWIKATVLEGSYDDLMSGGVSTEFQSFIKDNKVVWDVSKAFVLVEESSSDKIVFYMPIK